MMKIEEKICAECGIVFTPTSRAQKYCSTVCSDAARKLNEREYKARRRVLIRAKKSYSKKSWMPLAEKAARARDAGMSYGQYVGMMRCKEEKFETKFLTSNCFLGIANKPPDKHNQDL